ncbi:Predicted arabinose efflux permease, MFS family [Micromonospora coriariae]|uniref:Predicted arabinose efflux permease, MFS family n=1 Tax=Micromonospora coriariae TaxID=285665 RepID=A0A1C4VRW3_9ACTN|nr:MFS transporter [Micromonospora coriariae]SCE86732.1 Predicted arabinose efflux permease, MFS family [Micromonospora coriariae]
MPVKTLSRYRPPWTDVEPLPASHQLPPGFGLLWAGQGVSEFGTAIAGLALPLLAALHLGADSVQLGWLGAAAMLPWLLALPIGAWMDRVPARPVIVTAELTRAAATLLIPALWLAGSLSLSRLYLLVAVIGLAQVFFETAWGTALPRMVGHGALLAAHSRLESVRSATSVGGPGVAGLLIRAVGPAAALVVDALSYLVSAATAWRALPHGPATVGDQPREPLLTAIRAGLTVITRTPMLRAMALQATIWNSVTGATQALFMLYALRVLGLGPGGIGVLLMIGGIGALLGSTTAPMLLRRLAFGPTYIVLVLVACLGTLLTAAVTRPLPVALALVGVGEFLVGVGIAVTRVQAVSLRQTITPAPLLARMLATYRLLAFGTVPLGSVLGGFLGGALGLRAALLLIAIAGVAAAVPLLLSPIRTLRTLPHTSTEGPLL